MATITEEQSTFPTTIDTFKTYLDIDSSDRTNYTRYKELMDQATLTTDEQTELNTLSVTLSQKIITASTINKMNNCIVALETFFKYQTETYIESLFEDYDNRMETMEKTASETNEKAENIITETTDWYNQIRNNLTMIAEPTFDEWIRLNGVSYDNTISDDYLTVNEVISNTATGVIMATRKTEYSSDYTTLSCRIVIYDDDGTTILYDKTNSGTIDFTSLTQHLEVVDNLA